MAQAKQFVEKKGAAAKDKQLRPVNTIYYCFFITHQETKIVFLSSSFTITNSNLIPWYHSLFLALGVGAPRQDRWRLCHNPHSEGALSSPTLCLLIPL